MQAWACSHLLSYPMRMPAPVSHESLSTGTATNTSPSQMAMPTLCCKLCMPSRSVVSEEAWGPPCGNHTHTTPSLPTSNHAPHDLHSRASQPQNALEPCQPIANSSSENRPALQASSACKPVATTANEHKAQQGNPSGCLSPGPTAMHAHSHELLWSQN